LVNLSVSASLKGEKLTSLISIVEDTLKKEAEHLIKKSETRFKSLFDDSPIPMWKLIFQKLKTSRKIKSNE
jgi:hypothetical protein